MLENKEVHSNDSSVAKVCDMQDDPLVKKINDPTLKSILKYQNDPGILAREEKLKSNSVFTFCHITLEEILKEIGNLDFSKSSEDIIAPTQIIKENSDIFASFICESFSNMINSSIFPAALKLAHITPVLKNGFINLKENYGPVSILPKISKHYERCMYKKMSNNFGNFCPNFNLFFDKNSVRNTGFS